mmetsp:Transcript_4722/g.6364  ORF Transcript_4722/g.6364 Transcript_4722/m.6364 type:complete len:342 (-) Transcript_4722:104-1129(-)
MDAEEGLDIDESYPEPKPEKVKAQKQKQSINFPVNVFGILKSNLFVAGALLGMFLGAILVYSVMNVHLERNRLEVLQLQLESHQAQLPTDKVASLCSSKLEMAKAEKHNMYVEMTAEISGLREQNLRANMTIEQFAQRCSTCDNATTQAAEEVFQVEKRCAEEKSTLEKEVNNVRAEESVWRREKMELASELKGQVATTLQKEKIEAARALENHKRELEVAHHTEMLEHKAAREKAERLAEMSKQDRDQTQQDAKDLETRVNSCNSEINEIKNGKSTDMNKITGELEALSAAVAECQKTASMHENELCQMCSHCTQVHFPICKRCTHNGSMKRERAGRRYG